MASMQMLVTTPLLLEIQPVLTVEVSVFYHTLHKTLDLSRFEKLKYIVLRLHTLRQWQKVCLDLGTSCV